MLTCPFLLQQFLNDYGLIWVGDRHEELEESLRDDELLAKRFWKAGKASVPFAKAAIPAPVHV